MDIENAIGTFKTQNGNTYIFLENGNILKKDIDGIISKIDITDEKTLSIIRTEIGSGQIDVE